LVEYNGQVVERTKNELDLLFTALADANRRKMILCLKSGSRTVEALREPLGITLWGTMKHLQILEESGLVTTKKIGRSRYCELQGQKLETVTQWIDEIQSFWAGNLERLAELVEEKNDPV
jgi:DNA-binding transcriptional ArsR family regulator